MRLLLRLHGPFDRFLLLGREGDGGAAALELLDVDARVVPPLDGAQDAPAARRVEQRDRSGLMPTRVLVGVVADDGEPRHRRLDAPFAPPERCPAVVAR